MNNPRNEGKKCIHANEPRVLDVGGERVEFKVQWMDEGVTAGSPQALRGRVVDARGHKGAWRSVQDPAERRHQDDCPENEMMATWRKNR